MKNDTPELKKPLSKRDKVLGYGFLLPVMVCGALAFLSDLLKDKASDPGDEAGAVSASNRGDNSPMPFKAKDAQYILDTAGDLFNEAQNLADESYASLGLSQELSERLKHLRVKQRALVADITDSGYDPRLRSAGTVRDELYFALAYIGQICKIAEEMAASKTDESRRTAGELARMQLKTALDHLGKARSMLGMMEDESQNDML